MGGQAGTEEGQRALRKAVQIILIMLTLAAQELGQPVRPLCVRRRPWVNITFHLQQARVVPYPFGRFEDYTFYFLIREAPNIHC